MSISRPSRNPATGAPPVESWEWRLTLVILAATAIRTVLLLFAAWPHTTDDAYITLRYARHLSQGIGLVWNTGGEPVEGYSNFLFVLIGAVSMRLGAANPMPILKSLGAAALVGSGALTFFISRRWLRPAAATLPFLLLSGYAGSVLWAVSGLETSVYQFLVLLAVLLTLRAQESQDPAERRRLLISTAVAGFLLSLARPEGPVIVLLLLTYVAFGFREKGRTLSIGSLSWLKIPFLSLYLPYTGWRTLYFGRSLPYSVSCKAGYAEAPLELIGEFLSFAWVVWWV